MLRKVNAQGLMDLIRANEEAPDFALAPWVASCGTFGCLVGNWAIKHSKLEVVHAASAFNQSAKEFGLSLDESLFLFDQINVVRGKWGVNNDICGRNCYDREAAINRVRKFLYYKLRKWELLYEDDGRVKESARREEGDKHVCRRALEACCE